MQNNILLSLFLLLNHVVCEGEFSNCFPYEVPEHFLKSKV